MTAAAVGVVAPEIKLNGALLTPAWSAALVSVRVERALGLVGRASLRFADGGYTQSANSIFALGAEVEIFAREHRLLRGTVTGMALEQSVGETPELVVVVDDIAYKLTRGNAVKTFLKASYSDAIRATLNDAGISDADIESSTEVNEYLLRSGTALSFLDAITRRIGYAWWVDGTDGPGTIMVKKIGTSTGEVGLTLGEDLLEFSLRASGLRPTETSVTGWNRDDQQMIKASTPGTAPDGLPHIVNDYAAASDRLGKAEIAASVNPSDNGEATVLATSLADEAIAASIVARGRCYIDARIKPAMTVQARSAGPASGSYLVTEVEHTYDRRGFFTRFVAGSPRPSHLVDLLGRPAPDPGFVISTLVVGVVSNPYDEENAGRVRVRFTGLNGEIETAWARVLSVGAGRGRGTVFVPEVNDEVLLGFEHGDTRRPVVLGGLFSKANNLPSSGAGVESAKVVNFRRITSRLGHVIELGDGDKETEQHVLLMLGNNVHKLRLGVDSFDLEVAEGKPVTIKAGNAKFAISNAGDVTIEGKNITLKAQQGVTVDALGQVAVKSVQAVEVQGAEAKVTATGMASVQASGILTLKGAQVAIN
jgi:uncharacterized protein involved in type VI secretion and phage assembly